MEEKTPKEILESLDEVLGEMVQAAHESGELRHLYGRPLDLSDDPEWLVGHFVKQAGFTHPLLERRSELDRARQRVEEIVRRLEQRRQWLTGPEARPAPVEVSDFNEWRAQQLESYREALTRLNRRIRDYNLTAPMELHGRHLRVDNLVLAVAQRIPPIEAPEPAPPTVRRSRLSRWRKRRV